MRIIAALCLGLFACDDGGAPLGVDGGPGGAGGAGGVGGAGGADDAAFEVAVAESDGLITLADGATVGFEWGFQGGTMIRPAVLLPAASVAGVEEVRVTLRHRPDPAAPEAFGELEAFPGLILDLPVDPHDGTHRIVGPIDDQLGWLDLDGTRFVLEVIVDGPAGQARRSFGLTIEGEATPCDPFPAIGGGCVYREIPGRFAVTAHAPAADCAGAVVPIVAFAPTDDGAGVACIDHLGFADLVSQALPWPGLEGGADPACLAEIGLGLDGGADGSVSVIQNGGCAPFDRLVGFDASACAACR